MRILVYTPSYAGGMRPESAASLQAQQTEHDWEWIVDESDPFPTPDHRNVLAKYKRARKIVLDQGYDALLTFEHDMLLPPDAIQKMALPMDAGAVYAPYVLRHGSHVLNTWQRQGTNNLGMSLTLYPQELKRYIKAGYGPVCGCGWGFTLIYRDTLERIPFHDGNGANPPGDIQFAIDCLRGGVMAMGRFDVPCGHYNELGRLLMPYDDAPPQARVLALFTMNVQIGNDSVRILEGIRYTMTRDQAYELERAGYVRVLPVEPDQAPEHAIIEPPEQAVAPAQRKRRKEP